MLPRSLRHSAVLLCLAGCGFLVPAGASAQTLNFDGLPAAPGVAGSSLFVDANAGSRALSGITFNAADHSDWEIYGNAYQAFGANNFADSRSGAYVLAGNAYVGDDFSGTHYDGLTISTNRVLTGVYVGFDDDGGGSNDADRLTITAFGALGDLAFSTIALTSRSLTLMNTAASFGSLSGITGYRFSTAAADDLNAAFGRAYLVADDMSFGRVAPVPEPSTALSLCVGLLAIGWQAWRRRSPSVPLLSELNPRNAP